MRKLGFMLLVASAGLAACAGPADPSVADGSTAYRTGSRIKQPDGVQPNLSYYGQNELSRSPDQTLTGAILHSPRTPVPPPPEPPAD
ncbi:MAG TPA: hypothetical protein VGV37_09845 [Aliidongia sp.]|uniref:hypothetical protein n=1 Tax=Aliidongia sp. TaxID=1914230 RepID=UPI002DDCBE1C|nr:hypothetical protein [Aliidongia sp.]HEV2674832.1 hypothetical protein [Aliidongia sp.]